MFPCVHEGRCKVSGSYAYADDGRLVIEHPNIEQIEQRLKKPEVIGAIIAILLVVIGSSEAGQPGFLYRNTRVSLGLQRRK
jgi:hypothetical protein